jgi:hypothetical protein
MGLVVELRESWLRCAYHTMGDTLLGWCKLAVSHVALVPRTIPWTIICYGLMPSCVPHKQLVLRTTHYTMGDVLLHGAGLLTA